MHWADKIAKEIIASGKHKPYWVDDMKTPSGFAHIGSLMGPVIHSAIFRSLKDAGQNPTITFVINDFDHADSLSTKLKEAGYEKYMGMSLKMIPSPEPKYENMADYFGADFVSSIRDLGVEAKILSSWEMYHRGAFDEVIRIALDNSEKIQDIYHKVSGSDKKEKGWLPFQVICEKCQKLGTTRVYAWDGEKVSYKCEPDMVTWAKGCGHEGKVSPFSGNGKLPWKVDWAAHWKVIGVTIEGAGKDHASAGGSYDIAMASCKEVFNYEKPFRLPYEFILIGGKKMSSSKGLGLKAHDLVKILPASVARFLFISADIFSQSNFDPMGTLAIPDLFDEYDKAWEAYDKGGDEKLARTYELSQIDSPPQKEKGFFIPRFRDIANYLSQGFSLDEIVGKLNEAKGGKIDDSEMGIIEERVRYANTWLDNYAPDEFRFEMTEEVPDEAKKLSDEQKKYLGGIIKIVEKEEDAGKLQIALYELSKEMGIPTKDAFAAIYTAFIGKSHGPRAGTLLSKFGKEKVLDRIDKIVSGQFAKEEIKDISFITLPEYFDIDDQVRTKFPSISVGVALIKNVLISPAGKDLRGEIDDYLTEQKNLTTEILGEFPEIVSYRKLYKEMGIDWHSRRPGPEELLRRIALKKGLYNINNCVDAYNLVVMKNHISVGAFDADKVKFPTLLHFGPEGDKVFLIGNKEPVIITSKELAYYDKEGAYNLDFNYRDSQRTMITEKTTNLWINVDGIFDVTPEKVQKTLDEAVEKILRYCGGKLEFKGVVR